MPVVGGVAPMTLEMLRSMRLVHRVETTKGSEYSVTLTNDPLAIYIASPSSTCHIVSVTSGPLPAASVLIFCSSTEF